MVERVVVLVLVLVLVLHRVDRSHDNHAFETDEREQLCGSVGEALAEHGVDVHASTARHGLEPYELTVRWREW
ncbi:hypothetical protein ACFV0T_02880 [Streptomyces sp. NPDC059582]|uniref:hypothetical protein n=1 Tax=Streptomyces sp. NPDC059582 TaxID=3346875 RepID=UPI00369871AD